MKSLESLVVATTIAIGSASAYAQDAVVGTDAAPVAAAAQTALVNAPHNGVIRYSAGDSIPLGLPHPQITPGVEISPVKPSAPPTRLGRYSAGESIALAYPSASHASLQAGQSAQAVVPGYSAAANLPLAGALGDSLTTHIGISQAGLSEANGLLNTSPAGLVGLFVIKAGMVYYLDQQKPEVRKAGLKTTAGVWGGFTMNNLLLIAGSTNPLSLVGGALFGAYMYHREGISLEKEAAAKAARESTARQAAARAGQEFHAQAK